MDNTATKEELNVDVEINLERSINDVLQESADLKMIQQETPYMADVERQSLTELATQRPEMSEKLGEARWSTCMEKWSLWESCDDDKLGTAVQTVITDLDAPHLLPSLINKQLENGNVAASFSFLTLMSNLSKP